MNDEPKAPAAPKRLRRVFSRRVAIIGLLIAGAIIGYVLHGSAPPPPPSGGESSQSPGVSAGESSEQHQQVWTCSMHPQIRSLKPGKCPICGMDLIPVTGEMSSASGGMREYVTSEGAAALMNIQTSPVERKFVTAQVRMVGKVDYDETKLAYITAWVPGRIDAMYVDYTGIQVKKGDHMVYLYSPELLVSADELRRTAEALRTMRPNAPETLRDAAQTTLTAVREKLRRLGLTEEQINQAEKKGIPSDHVTIYAPIGGTVIQRNGQEGMYVDVGTRIYTIADLTQVWVKLDAYESDLPWLRYGQRVDFTTEAYPGDQFEGRISFIDPVLNDKTRTVNVRVSVPNPDGRLKPEMFVRAVVRTDIATGGRVMESDLIGKWISPMHPEIIRDQPGKCPICGMDLVRAKDLGYVTTTANVADKPLVIPATAPLITGKRAVVYVKVPDAEKPTFEGREIVLGPRADGYYIVKSGLAEGEQVVTHGNFKIDSALQIMAKPSMMSPDGGAMPAMHHHGESPGEQGEAMQMPEALSPTTQQQLGKVADTYDALVAARATGDRALLNDAVTAFKEAVDGVDTSLLTGTNRAAWVEYAMRLANDVVLIRDAQTEGALQDAMDGLKHDMEQAALRLPIRSSEHPAGVVMELSTPAAFQAQVRGVYAGYLKVADALAQDQADAASKGAAAALDALKKVDMTLLSGDAHQAWMAQEKGMQHTLQAMASANDLDTLREGFDTLSQEVQQVIETFGIAPGDPVYQIHCPMAFGGKGADWLQPDKNVRNPYFGSAMQNCGNVVTRLDAPGAAAGSHGGTADE